MSESRLERIENELATLKALLELIRKELRNTCYHCGHLPKIDE